MFHWQMIYFIVVDAEEIIHLMRGQIVDSQWYKDYRLFHKWNTYIESSILQLLKV